MFSNDAFTATTRIGDLDDAFTTLAGNFVSVQTAQLNVTGGFDGLEAASQAAGASMKGTNTQSVGLQQSFYAQAAAIEQAANAMVQNGDTAQTVTGYINTQITAPCRSTRAAARTPPTAVQGLKNWEDSLTGSLQDPGLVPVEHAVERPGQRDPEVLRHPDCRRQLRQRAGRLREELPAGEERAGPADRLDRQGRPRGRREHRSDRADDLADGEDPPQGGYPDRPERRGAVHGQRDRDRAGGGQQRADEHPGDQPGPRRRRPRRAAAW